MESITTTPEQKATDWPQSEITKRAPIISISNHQIWQ
jgi:hypothetical protein